MATTVGRPGTPARRRAVACTAPSDLLEVVAARGGTLTIGEIAAADRPPAADGRTGWLRTLVDLGYLRQAPDRALRPRASGSSCSAASSPARCSAPGTAASWAHLVDELGETANLAMLDGDQVAYVAQVPGRHAMRMFTEVGRRVHPHCTAVGKAAARRGPRRRGPGAARPHRPAPPHPAHDDRPRRVPRPARARSASAATPSTRASRRSASAASRSRCPAAPSSWGSRSPGRLRG